MKPLIHFSEFKENDRCTHKKNYITCKAAQTDFFVKRHNLKNKKSLSHIILHVY